MQYFLYSLLHYMPFIFTYMQLNCHTLIFILFGFIKFLFILLNFLSFLIILSIIYFQVLINNFLYLF